MVGRTPVGQGGDLAGDRGSPVAVLLRLRGERLQQRAVPGVHARDAASALRERRLTGVLGGQEAGVPGLEVAAGAGLLVEHRGQQLLTGRLRRADIQRAVALDRRRESTAPAIRTTGTTIIAARRRRLRPSTGPTSATDWWA